MFSPTKLEDAWNPSSIDFQALWSSLNSVPQPAFAHLPQVSLCICLLLSLLCSERTPSLPSKMLYSLSPEGTSSILFKTVSLTFQLLLLPHEFLLIFQVWTKETLETCRSYSLHQGSWDSCYIAPIIGPRNAGRKKVTGNEIWNRKRPKLLQLAM